MFLRTIAVTFITSAMMFAQPTTSSTTRSTTIGPVGVGSTETVQITVANLATNPTNGGNAASCAGSITFNDATGKAIQAATNFTVTAGQISSVSLPFNKIASTGNRAEVIGVVSLTTANSNRTPCSLRYALETFDTQTGATHVYLTGGSFPGIPVLFNSGGDR